MLAKGAKPGGRAIGTPRTNPMAKETARKLHAPLFQMHRNKQTKTPPAPPHRHDGRHGEAHGHVASLADQLQGCHVEGEVECHIGQRQERRARAVGAAGGREAAEAGPACLCTGRRGRRSFKERAVGCCSTAEAARSPTGPPHARNALRPVCCPPPPTSPPYLAPGSWVGRQSPCHAPPPWRAAAGRRRSPGPGSRSC